MTIINKSIEINGTRETIRPYYAHPVYTPQWATGLTVWGPEEEWPSVGATSRMGVKSGGISAEGTATSLEYDDETMDHHFRFESNRLPPMNFWWTFDEREGKTMVTYKIEYTIPGSFLGQAVDKLFVERQNTRDIEQQLINLKEMAENGG